MKYNFEIVGRPFGKQRPTFVRRGRFSKVITPLKTVNYEVQVKEAFVRECNPNRLLTGPLGIILIVYHYIPKSTSKVKRQNMIDGLIRPELTPDWDNIGKVVCDALNQMAYADDKQIVDSHVLKYYGERPRVEVEVWEVGGLV